MAFHMHVTLTVFCLSLMSIHGALPSEQYWNSVLPATSMPTAITNILHTGHRSARMPIASVGNSFYGNNRKYGVCREDLGVNGFAGSKIAAGNKKYGNSDYGGTGEHRVPVNPPTALFFLEKELYPGKELKLEINRRENSDASAFIPRRMAGTIPFSSDKLSIIFSKLSVKPGSKDADMMKDTIKECEEPANKGEERECVTSLESMIDFTVAALGNNIQAVSTVAEKDTKFQSFRIVNGIERLASDEAVVCHKENYPYAVFYCHALKGTRSYLVPLVGADGTKAKATAVCHTDTSTWNPKHMALRILNVKAVCATSSQNMTLFGPVSEDICCAAALCQYCSNKCCPVCLLGSLIEPKVMSPLVSCLQSQMNSEMYEVYHSVLANCSETNI